MKEIVCVHAIFTWNYLQNLHRTILIHTTNTLKKLLTLHFWGKYVWQTSLLMYLFFLPLLKDFTLFLQLKLTWNFISMLLCGTWRGFDGCCIDLHEPWGATEGCGKKKKLYWFSIWSWIRIVRTKKAWSIKGYLHYKTITSQNVSCDAQVKNFFIS